MGLAAVSFGGRGQVGCVHALMMYCVTKNIVPSVSFAVLGESLMQL